MPQMKILTLLHLYQVSDAMPRRGEVDAQDADTGV